MDKNEEKILSILSGKLSGGDQAECPSLEDISALIDGTIDNDLKEDFHRHIASCDSCYGTYITASKLVNTYSESTSRIFSPWSIAATLLIALISFVIFYKVYVGDRGIKNTIPDLDSNPGAIVEKSKEKEKERAVQPSVGKTAGKKSDKRVLHKKAELKKKPVEVLPSEEESLIEKDDPPVRPVAARAALRNVQGISQAGNEPVKAPAVLSVQRREMTSGDEEKRQSTVSLEQKKREKGLVDRLSENKKEEIKGDDLNCFRKEGTRYHRYERFSTSIKLENNPPKISYKVNPKFPGRFKDGENREIVTVEVYTDEHGVVEKACLLAGRNVKIGIILKALKEWRFSVPGNVPVRFRLVLELTGEGIIEILNSE